MLRTSLYLTGRTDAMNREYCGDARNTVVCGPRAAPAALLQPMAVLRPESDDCGKVETVPLWSAFLA